MALIYESNHFRVEAADAPLVGRDDGGHIVINPKARVGALQSLTPEQAIELMRLLMVVGEAMSTVLIRNGIDIGRINYQDNGNWGVFKPEGPYQHFHLYGRAKSAVLQKYGQACEFPHRDQHPEFYKGLKSLNSDDISGIKSEISRLLSLDQYSNEMWNLKTSDTKVKAVLFDMIGTTVLEKNSNSIMDSFKQAFQEHGVIPDEEIIRANRGKDKMEMIHIILQSGDHPANLGTLIFQSFKRNLRSKLNNFEEAQGVQKVFESLRQMGIQIGLGSGLPADIFEEILIHLEWDKNDFQYIGISSALGKARPNPIMIIDMMKSLQITDQSELVKVGDTVADIEEGKNAGVRTIAIQSGTQSQEKLAKASPDYLVKKIADVSEIIRAMK